MGLHQSYRPIGFACVFSVFIHLNFRLVMRQIFSEENLLSLGFEIDSPWGDDSLSDYSMFLGQGMTMHIVNFNEAFLEVDGKIKELQGIKNIASLTSGLLLFGQKVDISKALNAMDDQSIGKNELIIKH